MLNFRYLFILFLFLSSNSYSERTVCAALGSEPDKWYCVSTQNTVQDGETFSYGLDERLEDINNNTSQVINNFDGWEVHHDNPPSAGWSSLLDAPVMTYSNASKAQVASNEAKNDANSRLNNSNIMLNYAYTAMLSATSYNNNSAYIAANNTIIYNNNASVHASSAAQSASDAANSASDVADNVNRVNQAQTQALTDINNQITGIVDDIDDVQTKALTDIDQYVSDVLNTQVNVVDNIAVMSATLDTNTNTLNSLTNAISNTGSENNTDLINALDGLSDSVANLGSASQVGTLNAIGDLDGSLGNNTQALGGLSDSITNSDGNGAINNGSAGLFNELKNSLVGSAPSFASSGANCPTWAFDDGALLVGGLVIDSHCEVINMVRSNFEIMMLSFFSILGFRTVFSA